MFFPLVVPSTLRYLSNHSAHGIDSGLMKRDSFLAEANIIDEGYRKDCM